LIPTSKGCNRGDVRENQETVEKEGVNNSIPDGVITISRGCNREDVGRNQEVQRRRYNVSLSRIDLPTLFSLVLLNLLSVLLLFLSFPSSFFVLLRRTSKKVSRKRKEKTTTELQPGIILFVFLF
jgi:hypothetical protein